jgi:hypothetical protein
MLALFGVFPVGATTLSIDVSNSTASCNTLSGTITWATPLTNVGLPTGANTMTINAHLHGCFSNNTAVGMFSGTLKGTISTNGGSDCNQLRGVTFLVTGATAQIVWAPHAGQTFVPKVTVGSTQKAITNVSFPGAYMSFGSFPAPGSGFPWFGNYGKFLMGAPNGTASFSNSVDFTGGDGGAGSWLSAAIQEDSLYLTTQCASTTGVKTLHISMGGVGSG